MAKMTMIFGRQKHLGSHLKFIELKAFKVNNVSDVFDLGSFFKGFGKNTDMKIFLERLVLVLGIKVETLVNHFDLGLEIILLVFASSLRARHVYNQTNNVFFQTWIF